MVSAWSTGDVGRALIARNAAGAAACDGQRVAPRLALLALLLPACSDADPTWRLSASTGVMVGGYGDNFVYDGSDLRPGDGSITIEVDPTTDTGTLVATWTGAHQPSESAFLDGELRFEIDAWAQMAPWEDGGVAEDVELHGATAQGPPVLPRVRAFVAGWGPARVTLDGEPLHTVHGHFMYTDGVRGEDGRVLRADREALYDPRQGSDGWTDPDDREIHLAVHSADEDARNYPGHTIWYHLLFESPVVERAPGWAAR